MAVSSAILADLRGGIRNADTQEDEGPRAYAIAGVVYSSDIVVHAHNELLIFTALFMIGAAVVLYAGDRRLIRGASIQGGPPVLALLAALVF